MHLFGIGKISVVTEYGVTAMQPQIEVYPRTLIELRECSALISSLCFQEKHLTIIFQQFGIKDNHRCMFCNGICRRKKTDIVLPASRKVCLGNNSAICFKSVMLSHKSEK